MDEPFLMAIVQSVAALAVVLAVFAGLVWLLRRLQTSTQKQHGENMKVLRRLPLDAKHSLVEVFYDGRHYLIGLSPTGMTSISRHIDKQTVSATESESS
ncbi:flagellar biosynthetic protein FliO [Mariprofundus ferrinatatus]|uniref:Flagellar biosynthetic protein FliO n=1 Tax=Mariprofundus ferrinatatus TaxID=1921087 RepID=A0A2K8LF63_9PROT|nr:flagellar biosynthetic protein FliO [Mariprofundus ferrinatatus]ATX82906.1 flagellar biosynthetic protein FliO [Mariprofundus ferrinatatus]